MGCIQRLGALFFVILVLFSICIKCEDMQVWRIKFTIDLDLNIFWR